MNVTSFMQSSSLKRELLLQTQNSCVLLTFLCFGCTPMCKTLWDRIGIKFFYGKLEVVCDLDTV